MKKYCLILILFAAGGCSLAPKYEQRESLSIGMTMAQLTRLRDNGGNIPMSFLREDSKTITYRLWLTSEGRATPFACTFEKAEKPEDMEMVVMEVDHHAVQLRRMEREINSMELRMHRYWW